MEQIWIDINEDAPNNGDMVLIWQENLSDEECSRWQKALYRDHGEVKYFETYPVVFREHYVNNDNYIGSDLEGDKIQITHWMRILKSPSISYINKFKMDYVFTFRDEEICCVSIAKKVDFDNGHEASIDLPRGLYADLETKGIYEMMEGIFEIEDVGNTRQMLLEMGMTENKV